MIDAAGGIIGLFVSIVLLWLVLYAGYLLVKLVRRWRR